MMLMKWLLKVIVIVQIVNIFCSPPHLFFHVIFVPIKNYTNFFFFFGFFLCVLDVFTKGNRAIKIGRFLINWVNIKRN